MSILNYVRDAVSGMSGGFLSNLILHPFDLVRNRLAGTLKNILRTGPPGPNPFGTIKCSVIDVYAIIQLRMERQKDQFTEVHYL